MSSCIGIKSGNPLNSYRKRGTMAASSIMGPPILPSLNRVGFLLTSDIMEGSHIPAAGSNSE